MKFLSVLLRMSNSSGDFENLNACTCRWIAVRCSFMYNSWMNACFLSAKGVLAHVQLQQYNQKQECIQATSNICGCLGVLIYTCPMWAHVPGHTDTPFISSTNWKKDRFAQVRCADWRQVDSEQAAVHILGCWLGSIHHINTSLPTVKWKKCTCGETTHFVNWMDLITLCCWGCSSLEKYRVHFGLCKSHCIYLVFIDFWCLSSMWNSSSRNNYSAPLILPSLLCHGHL